MHAQRNYQRWTPSEDRAAQEMLRRGFNCKQVATELGRTHSAVRLRKSNRYAEELARPRRRRRTWTEEDMRTALEMHESGKTYQEID